MVPRGLQWPLGLAVGADGAIFVADGAFAYTLRPGGALELAGMIFYPGCPGYLRGVATGAAAGEWIVTTGTGAVARYRPWAGESDVLASGCDQLMGVAVAPGGAVVVAEYGIGRLLAIDGGEVRTLAEGLDRPMGVAVGDDGTIYVAEAGAGRVLAVAGGRTESLIDGLGRPEGLALHGCMLFVVDSEAKALLRLDPRGGAATTIASALPVGAPAGVTPKFLGPIGDMAGPMIPFADVAAAADGKLYVSGDAEGSVLSIRAA